MSEERIKRIRFCGRRIDAVKQFYREIETERILSDIINNPKKYLDIVEKEMKINKLDDLKEK